MIEEFKTVTISGLLLGSLYIGYLFYDKCSIYSLVVSSVYFLLIGYMVYYDVKRENDKQKLERQKSGVRD